MEDENKGCYGEPLLSPSEQERLKYLSEHISELQEPQLSELSELLNKMRYKIDYVEKTRRREDPLKKQLKERLEKEGWQVKIAPGREKGPDLEAVKEKDKGKREIIAEVKGEPGSAKTASGQRIKYIGDALLTILNRMGTQSSDVRPSDIRYCLVFPYTYLPVVKPRLHAWVREKLGLYILFLKGEPLEALYPTLEHEVDLRGFDEWSNQCCVAI